MNTCPACAKPIHPNDLVCPHCGITLHQDAPAAPAGGGSSSSSLVAIVVIGIVVVLGILLVCGGLMGFVFFARTAVVAPPPVPVVTPLSAPVDVEADFEVMPVEAEAPPTRDAPTEQPAEAKPAQP